MGATLGLPLLPLFLEHRGGVPTIIGFIMASFFVAGVVTQFFLGRLADRFGRRPILIYSLLAYGVASTAYLLPVSAPWFALARAVQGASAGAIEVASMSAVAALFSESERGRAISRIIAAQLLGLALGPIAGVVVSVNSLGWAFFAAGMISFVAAIVAVPHEPRRPGLRSDAAAEVAVEPATHGRPRRRERQWPRHRRLRGLLEPVVARASRLDAADPTQLDDLLSPRSSR